MKNEKIQNSLNNFLKNRVGGLTLPDLRLALSYSNQDNKELAKQQTHRSTEQSREHRYRPQTLTDFQQRCKGNTIQKAQPLQ